MHFVTTLSSCVRPLYTRMVYAMVPSFFSRCVICATGTPPFLIGSYATDAVDDLRLLHDRFALLKKFRQRIHVDQPLAG